MYIMICTVLNGFYHVFIAGFQTPHLWSKRMSAYYLIVSCTDVHPFIVVFLAADQKGSGYLFYDQHMLYRYSFKTGCCGIHVFNKMQPSRKCMSICLLMKLSHQGTVSAMMSVLVFPRRIWWWLQWLSYEMIYAESFVITGGNTVS